MAETNEAAPPDRVVVAERVRAARVQRGLKQGEVAAWMGMHRPTISEIEAGRRRVSADELARFAELFGVEVDWLLGRDPAGANPGVELAARELARLKPADLDVVLKLLKNLRRSGGKES